MSISPLQAVVLVLLLMIAIVVVCRILAGSVREFTSHERGPDVAARGRRFDHKHRKP
jgi:hypothetical protein